MMESRQVSVLSSFFDSNILNHPRLQPLYRIMGVSVREVMQRQIVSVQASAPLRDFAHSVSAHHRHAIFPVYDGDNAVGTVAVWILSRIPSERWDRVKVGEVCNRATDRVPASCDLLEALRLLLRQDRCCWWARPAVCWRELLPRPIF